MSVAVARSTESSSLEPTAVVGNEGESGSLRAPQTQGRANMTAVEGKSDGVAILVVEWQGSKGKAQTRLADLIMRLLQPTIRRVAMRFGASARGSLSKEDLEQVASIEAFKFFSKYDHSSAGSTSFEQHVYRRALRACVEHTRMHATDVRVGDWTSRARRTVAGVTKNGKLEQRRIHVQSRDASGDGGDSDFEGARELDDGGSAYSLARSGAITEDPSNPEAMLSTAELRQDLAEAMSSLTPEARELVRDSFGIGRDDVVSLRANADRKHVPRSRLADELEQALEVLRDEMT